MLKKSIFVFALMMSACAIPAYADDVSNRVDALEGQVRQLVGQLEELNYAIKQMQAQQGAAPQKMGAVEQPAVIAPPPKKKLVMQKPVQAEITGQASDLGVETIQEAPMAAEAPQPAQEGTLYGGVEEGTAPQETVLGAMSNKASKIGDGGFEGKVLVPRGGDQVISEAIMDENQTAGVEAVSLQETPDDLFMKSEKALLQLQYGDAQTGFKEFLAKYPDHNLAGSAQYKLGETYYAQQDYSDAAQNYLTGYKQFPKSRRAADSLLKLGLSLNKLGQKEQGCAALGSVGSEFPKAVEANKRAQAEYKRAGC